MQKLSQLAINSEGFVFNPATGDSFQVSQTGLEILNGLRDGKSDEDIVQKLTDTYEVSLDDARRDLADFRGNLKSLCLI
ncbi:MAG: PqqD family protein [Verrucomicrobiota bacterium]